MREQLIATATLAKRLAEVEKLLLTHDFTLRDLYQGWGGLRPLDSPRPRGQSQGQFLLPPPLPWLSALVRCGGALTVLTQTPSPWDLEGIQSPLTFSTAVLFNRSYMLCPHARPRPFIRHARRTKPYLLCQE